MLLSLDNPDSSRGEKPRRGFAGRISFDDRGEKKRGREASSTWLCRDISSPCPGRRNVSPHGEKERGDITHFFILYRAVCQSVPLGMLIPYHTELSSVIGTRTARYRAVPPKIDRRRSILAVDGRLKKKSIVGGRLRKKKGRRRGKEEKKKQKIPLLRAVAAHGRFFSHARRRSTSLRGEKDRGD
ncbi:hypothetical protein BHE74_00044065, partial [Ensete ventricosum]